MKIIQRAKFAATPVQFHSEKKLQVPAEVEINGVTLHSKEPQSAAEAERINKALEEASSVNA